MSFEVRVLGSAAGGGFPQWNCNCDNCAGLRAGTIKAQARNQSSIAISSNGEDWLLVNASPDIRQQIIDNPPLQPNRARRDTGIHAVLLMDSQIDHSTGLLMLREHQRPLEIYTSAMVHQDLTSGFPLLTILEHYCGVNWHELAVDGSAFRIDGIDGIEFEALALSSKAPPYSPHRHDPHPGDNIGLVARDVASGASLFYAPGLAELEPHLLPAMQAADVLLIDGTCWTDDEMSRRGVGSKSALAMGHRAQTGPGGMLEQLAAFPAQRRVLIHINNTNPILVDDGPEREQLRAAGVEIAVDGMQITLGGVR